VFILPHEVKLFCHYFVNSYTHLFEVVTWKVQNTWQDRSAWPT